MEYFNSKGEVVKITEMADAYLLNAYAKYSNRLKKLKAVSSQSTKNYIDQVEALVGRLRNEIDVRGLLEK